METASARGMMGAVREGSGGGGGGGKGGLLPGNGSMLSTRLQLMVSTTELLVTNVSTSLICLDHQVMLLTR